jgi:hypothetical protein
MLQQKQVWLMSRFAEIGSRNITVNCIAPLSMDMTKALTEIKR